MNQQNYDDMWHNKNGNCLSVLVNIAFSSSLAATICLKTEIY